ncbi:MAG: 50S ribosomal protein L29 [Planctomycetaceae bacterium]|nr:50S ribosomal protein L29 [Planctomycetaceae bacterium]
MKAETYSELRGMSQGQIAQLLKEARDMLFRLKLQSRMERLDSPSELKKNKRLIARILTLQNERAREEGSTK